MSQTSEQVAEPQVDVVGRLRVAHVPEKLMSRCLLGVDTSWPSYRGAKEWTERLGDAARVPFLLLLGASGAGKSVAATWAMGAAARRFPWNGRPTGSMQEPFTWVHITELETLGRFSDAEEWLRKVCSGHCVALDDMGTEAQSDGPYGTLSLVERIIGAREASQRLTILTSNLDGEGFKSRYGARIARRIRESGLVVNCGTESMRRKA